MSAQGTRETIERVTYTVEEARCLLGLGRASAYEAIRKGEIPVLHIGRRLLVPRKALERLLDGQQGER
ncbi:MAG: helix-turn-helix domain-containing protein [Dehalococcoidia bacterium]|nr:helix-turn-helix domain-containing protein [Dehalococcoidia bacterium]